MRYSGISQDSMLVNSLLGAYISCGHPDKAIEVWSEEPREPDIFVYTTLLIASVAKPQTWSLANRFVLSILRVWFDFLVQLHNELKDSGIIWDVAVWRALASMYMHCNSPLNDKLMWNDFLNFDKVLTNRPRPFTFVNHFSELFKWIFHYHCSHCCYWT